VVPKFWTGTPAIPFEKWQIDCSKFDMSKVLEKHGVQGDGVQPDYQINHDSTETKTIKAMAAEIFNDVGVVQLVKTGMTGFDEMEKLSKLIIGKGMWYEGGANLRGYLEKNVYDTGAPRHANLHYHHEMAYVKESTKTLSFLCEHAPKDPHKGATFISDNIQATETHVHQVRREAQAKGALLHTQAAGLEVL
jgi:hypothetical protein